MGQSILSGVSTGMLAAVYEAMKAYTLLTSRAIRELLLGHIDCSAGSQWDSVVALGNPNCYLYWLGHVRSDGQCAG